MVIRGNASVSRFRFSMRYNPSDEESLVSLTHECATSAGGDLVTEATRDGRWLSRLKSKAQRSRVATEEGIDTV